MNKSVSIVGCGPSAWAYMVKNMQGLGKPTDEVWAINRMALALRDVDLCIAMDDRYWIDSHPTYGGAGDSINKLGVPVLTNRETLRYKNSIAYPISEVREWLRAGDMRVLTNSTCFAVAYAAYKGFNPIHIYGFDFFERHVDTSEPELEKTRGPWHRYYANYRTEMSEPGLMGLCYILGILQERGITFVLQGSTTLLDADIPYFEYGYKKVKGRDDDIEDFERAGEE